MSAVKLLDNESTRVFTSRRLLDVPWGEAEVADPYDLLMVAGEKVLAGRYRRVDVPYGEVLVLKAGDRLPASLDGHVATYERMPDWQPSLLR